MKLDIDPTEDEKKSLCADIHRRNFFRKNAQLPLINVAETYARELVLVRSTKFRHVLQPYMYKALSELPIACGLSNRIGRQRRAEVMAFERLISDYDCDPDDLPIPAPIALRLFDAPANR